MRGGKKKKRDLPSRKGKVNGDLQGGQEERLINAVPGQGVAVEREKAIKSTT